MSGHCPAIAECRLSVCGLVLTTFGHIASSFWLTGFFGSLFLAHGSQRCVTCDENNEEKSRIPNESTRDFSSLCPFLFRLCQSARLISLTTGPYSYSLHNLTTSCVVILHGESSFTWSIGCSSKGLQLASVSRNTPIRSVVA